MNELQKITTFQEDIAIIKDSTTKVFLVAGKILQGIQDNKKYKEVGYKTFAEAVNVELGMKRSNAYELIDAAKTYEILSGVPDIFPENKLPTAVSQIRPMIKLLPEQLVEVWQEVAKDKVPTAKEVQEVVNIKFPKEKKPNVPKTTSVDNSTIDTTKYITIEEHNKIILEYEKACMSDVERLSKELFEVKNRLSIFESNPNISNTAPEKSTLLPRQIVYDFIKQKGNTIQCHALKSDDLSNDKLYSIFVKVRDDYKTSTPPPAWDMIIINATGIL